MLINTVSLSILNKNLTWNKARLKCLSSLVRSFIKNATVNLTVASTCMTKGTLKQSEYRKAQRFFESFLCLFMRLEPMRVNLSATISSKVH